MRGQMMFPHRNHSMCWCPCEQEGGRRFISKEEKKGLLKEYLEELEKETKAVRELVEEK